MRDGFHPEVWAVVDVGHRAEKYRTEAYTYDVERMQCEERWRVGRATGRLSQLEEICGGRSVVGDRRKRSARDVALWRGGDTAWRRWISRSCRGDETRTGDQPWSLKIARRLLPVSADFVAICLPVVHVELVAREKFSSMPACSVLRPHSRDPLFCCWPAGCGW